MCIRDRYIGIDWEIPLDRKQLAKIKTFLNSFTGTKVAQDATNEAMADFLLALTHNKLKVSDLNDAFNTCKFRSQRIWNLGFLSLDLSKARFEHVDFSLVRFLNCDLASATFKDCKFNNCSFEGSYLPPAINFQGCEFDWKECLVGSFVNDERWLQRFEATIPKREGSGFEIFAYTAAGLERPVRIYPVSRDSGEGYLYRLAKRHPKVKCNDYRSRLDTASIRGVFRLTTSTRELSVRSNFPREEETIFVDMPIDVTIKWIAGGSVVPFINAIQSPKHGGRITIKGFVPTQGFPVDVLALKKEMKKKKVDLVFSPPDLPTVFRKKE